MITAPASVNANSRNRLPVSPPEKPIGAYTANSVIVIAMTGTASSRAPVESGIHRRHALFDMALDILDDDDRVIDDQADRQMTIASSVSRLIVYPSASMMRGRADQ